MAINFVPGLLKEGKVVKTDQVNNNVTIIAGISPTSPSLASDLHFTYADNNGVFIGALPPENNPASILQGHGGKFQAIGYYPSDHTILPRLSPGQLLLKNNDFNRLSFLDNTITLGQFDGKGLVIDNSTDFFNSTIFNNNLDYHFSFSQSSRKINAAVKRELSETNFPDNLKLIQDEFYKNIPSISMISEEDTLNGGFSEISSSFLSFKNPSFIENRDLVYEFSYFYDVLDLKNESKNYEKDPSKVNLPTSDRRKSRSDTLSLSLTAPNYLMESVKGTVIDIYGNLLDLNRFPIKNNLQSNDDNSTVKNYFKIRENQRRSLAFHFEINARKDLGDSNNPPDVKSTQNYARDRSRFFIDIDKEGQFKINIPASSESGNIPLLTRYENYNTIAAADDSKINPNELLFPDDNIDILHDSFAAGIQDSNLKYDQAKSKIQKNAGYNRGLISIIDKGGAEVSPIDRISKDLTKGKEFSHIKHGTAFHDITATCIAHQRTSLVTYLYQKPPKWDEIFPYQVITEGVVSNQIKIGENAGGRSGSINLDGSIELNIGANTIDRQSVWIDTAGGMVANFGKDKNNISAAVNMDGQFLLHIGGNAIPQSQDSRFKNNNNAFTSGALDVRVLVDGYGAVVFRIDKSGITLMSPTRISLESNGDIDIRSSSNISIKGERVTIQDRVVEKKITSVNNTI
jgi:hypothetical protein